MFASGIVAKRQLQTLKSDLTLFWNVFWYFASRGQQLGTQLNELLYKFALSVISMHANCFEPEAHVKTNAIRGYACYRSAQRRTAALFVSIRPVNRAQHGVRTVHRALCTSSTLVCQQGQGE